MDLTTIKCDKCQTEIPMASTICYSCGHKVNVEIPFHPHAEMKFDATMLYASFIMGFMIATGAFFYINITTNWIHYIAVFVCNLLMTPFIALIIFAVYKMISRKRIW